MVNRNTVYFYVTFFLLYVFNLYSCDNPLKEVKRTSDQNLDSTFRVLDRSQEIIDTQLKKIEEMEEEWRVRDSIDAPKKETELK